MSEAIQIPRSQNQPKNYGLLLTRGGQYLPHIEELKLASTNAGHNLEIIYPVDIDNGNLPYDGVITRTPIVSAIRNLEDMNIPTLNSSKGVHNANDKWHTYELLKQNNLATTETYQLEDPNDLSRVISELNSDGQQEYFVSKTRFGAGGVGVEKLPIDSNQDFLIPDTKGQLPIIQKFRQVNEDYKLLIVGGVVQRVVYRKVQVHDFRSNASCSGSKQIHLPGTLNRYNEMFDGQDFINVEGYEIPHLSESDYNSMVSLACQAVNLFKLGLASVDFTFNEQLQPEILEIDASPWLPNAIQVHPKNIPELGCNNSLYASIITAMTNLL